MQKINKKILSFIFLPIFLIIGLPFINNSFKNKNISEDENFQIISSYFNHETLDYMGREYAEDDMTILITTGIYNGDISQINSITFSYQIKSENDDSYHDVSFYINKNLFKIKNLNLETYFYVELPVYYNYSIYPEYLKSDNIYYILNPTLSINNIDNTIINTTYEQDYKIKTSRTIYDNGDQSYPKIINAKKGINNKIEITYSDGDGFNFYDYSSYSLYHYAEYYDLYDTNNEKLLIKEKYKLIPISSASKITSTKGDGLYTQEFKFSDNEVEMPINYGYKDVNDSVIMFLNNDYKTTSFSYLFDEKTYYFTPSIHEKNVQSIDVNPKESAYGDNYLIFNINLKKINVENTKSFMEFTKNIKIGFNWNILVNVDDPYGGHNEWDKKEINYQSQEVSEINSTLLNTPGLYYQNSDIKATTNRTLNYTYYLVLPDEDDWIYDSEEYYAQEMIFGDFNFSFPRDLTYDSENGYKYYYPIGPDYENSSFIVIVNDIE
ncbi:MAG: hypothetical protein HPAVJP_2390 [Candidatus Hepatoplasma vulgare]|nr:MAG: hypothetical protein HPAVJP_2390 [Candidatus Hepatoplasma sp.]